MTGGGRTGGVSGNDFRGHGGAQGGSHNTQINFFGGPPRGGRRWVAIAVVALCALGLVGVVAWVVTSSGDNGSAESSGPSPSKSPSPAPPSRAAEGAEAPAPSASLSAPTSTIQWRGKVRIAEHGPRLDKVPPKIDAGSGDSFTTGVTAEATVWSESDG
ncbi:hypothetical protein ACWELB_40925 [Streptomyces asiaticus]